MTPPDRDTLAKGNWTPYVRAGIAVIVTTFAGFGGWMALAPIDSAVLAQGRISVRADRQAIQHLEGGIVAEILVTEDKPVSAGETLVRINAVQAKAGAGMLRHQVFAALAEEARLDAEAAGKPAITYPEALRTAAADAAVARAIADQTTLFASRAAARAAETSVIAERIHQAEQQTAGVDAQLKAAAEQIASFDDELSRLRPLLDKGLITRPRLTTIERQRTETLGRIGALEAEKTRLVSAIAENQQTIASFDRRRDDEISARLAQVRRDIEDLRGKSRVADDAFARVDIKAPRSGRIVNRKVHTIGAVIRPGDTLMELIPDDDTMIVTLKVNPTDIAHVHAGQTAEVRLPALKSRTTPMAFGKVATIAPDVVMDEATRQPFYTLQVSVDSGAFPAELRNRLVPGMPAEAVIVTEARTMLDYLVQPLGDAFRRGMRER